MLTLVAVVLSASAASPWTCEREDARVVRHLEDALIQLRTVTPPGLSDVQLARRAELLSLLRRYIDERQFPRSSGPTNPVFVDDDGRHCAMGALISWTGGAAMVEHIRTTRNLATVPTLADEPGLVDWLTEHGLVPEEAALVQPAYIACLPMLAACRVGIHDEVERELANGGTLPDGGIVRFRLARTNAAGTACEGDLQGPPPPDEWTPARFGTTELPVGAQFLMESSLLRTTKGLTPLSLSLCPGALVFDEAALRNPSFEACVAALVAAEPRALVPMCVYWGTGVFEASQLCDSSGRFRSSGLPAAGDVRALVDSWISDNGLDAGVLGSALGDLEAMTADAWAHSDDGGTPLPGQLPEPIIWDGGIDTACLEALDGGSSVTPTPAGSCGCQSASGFEAAALLALVAVAARRRRSTRPFE